MKFAVVAPVILARSVAFSRSQHPVIETKSNENDVAGDDLPVRIDHDFGNEAHVGVGCERTVKQPGEDHARVASYRNAVGRFVSEVSEMLESLHLLNRNARPALSPEATW